MAATMTSFMQNMDKLTYYINACKKHNVQVLGPDVNHSLRSFAVQGDAIRFGLGGIKNVGDNAIDRLIAEREANGLYTSITDFCRRVDSKVVNKRLLESLIRCGAMDGFEENRNQLLHMYESAQAVGSKQQKDAAMGTMSLFGESTDDVDMIPVPNLPDLSEDDKLKDEKDYTGFYITGHPLQGYNKELKGLFELGQLLENPERFDGQTITFGGLIAERGDRPTKRGDVMSILRIEDYSGSAQVVAFPKVFAQSEQFLAVDMVVKVRGRVDADEKGVQIIADRIAPLKVNYNNARQIAIHIRSAYDTPENSNALKDILSQAEGQISTSLYLHKQRKRINLSPQLCFAPTDEIIARIEAVLGEGAVEVQ